MNRRALTGLVPRPGDTVHISEHAATRFADAPIDQFRVIAAAPLPGRPGWCTLDGWDLDQWGQTPDQDHYEHGVEVIIAELTIRPGHAWGTR